MRNSKLKRFGAFVLATSLVFGSSIAAMAGGSVDLDGTGSSTGHLDKKVVSVTLPTVSGSSAFNYIIDPEGHIDATEKAKDGTSLSANASKVYFANKDASGNVTGYSATSDAFTVTNMSNVQIDLTVTAQVVSANTTDVTLVSAETDVTGNTAPKLFLGLQVSNNGTETTTAITSTGATKTVSMNGVEANYEETYNSVSNNYTMTMVSGNALQAWKEATVCLTGKINNAPVTENTTAPTVKVTWSWTDPSEAAADAAPSIATLTYTAVQDSALTVPVSLGSGDAKATGVETVAYINKSGAEVELTKDTDYRFDEVNSAVVIKKATVNAFFSATAETRQYVITFNDTKSTKVTITVSK